MKQHLPALTGLRFVAALGVIGVHFGLNCLPGVLHQLAVNGATGVSLFFVLSGFILTYTYAESTGVVRGGARAFWWARFARIYPVYLLGLVVGVGPLVWAPALPAYHPNSVLVAVSTIGLVQAWLPWVHYVWNSPSWSLSTEAMFYALFPLLLPRLARLPTRSLPIALVLCYVSALLGPSVYRYLHLDQGDPSALPLWEDVILYNPLPHVPEFVFGILLAMCFRRIPARVVRHSGPLSVLCASALLSLLAQGAALPGMYARNGALAPLFGLLILALAYGRGPIARILGSQLFSLLGEASYSMYLLHWPLHAWFVRASGLPDMAFRSSLPLFACYLGIVIAASILSFRLVEQPARQTYTARHNPPCDRLPRTGHDGSEPHPAHNPPQEGHRYSGQSSGRPVSQQTYQLSCTFGSREPPRHERVGMLTQPDGVIFLPVETIGASGSHQDQAGRPRVR